MILARYKISRRIWTQCWRVQNSGMQDSVLLLACYRVWFYGKVKPNVKKRIQNYVIEHNFFLKILALFLHFDGRVGLIGRKLSVFQQVKIRLVNNFQILQSRLYIYIYHISFVSNLVILHRNLWSRLLLQTLARPFFRSSLSVPRGSLHSNFIKINPDRSCTMRLRCGEGGRYGMRVADGEGMRCRQEGRG